MTDEFPRTPLGQTDSNKGRDVREKQRSEVVAATEPGSVDETAGLRCSLCGTLRGSWVKVHTAPGSDKPCRGSW